ncbi:hypothetical protein [Acidianus sp. HS-5]|uniref:hypothetical protein n=1 Tax=Acidianus sp. HS-5 TaxID=2886040 RepID=UPI001F31A7CF|nr:hypothetical protein [Acidianus sp. HS-5]BDC18749.1 hypothetical protein HS5_16390 [Acidianus sp. HS-5]
MGIKGKAPFKIEPEEIIKGFKDSVSMYLPNGEFSLEPFDIQKFLKETRFNVEEKFEIKPNITFYYGSDCSDNEIDEVNNKGGAEVNYKLQGLSGEAEYNIYIPAIITPKCEEYVEGHIIGNIMLAIVNNIENKFKNEYINELYSKYSIDDVIFIPFNRASIIKEIGTERTIIAGKFIISGSFEEKFESLVSSFAFNPKIYEMIKPFLRGEIESVGNKLLYKEGGKVINWNYVSASILELMGVLLSIKEKQLVLLKNRKTSYTRSLRC